MGCGCIYTSAVEVIDEILIMPEDAVDVSPIVSSMSSGSQEFSVLSSDIDGSVRSGRSTLVPLSRADWTRGQSSHSSTS